MVKDIRVYCKEVKFIKDNQQKSFKKYSAIDKNGKFMEVKFQEGSAKPTEAGYFMIKYDTDKVNIKKNKPFIKENGESVQTDTLWFESIIAFSKDVDYEKEVAERLEQEKMNRL